MSCKSLVLTSANGELFQAGTKSLDESDVEFVGENEIFVTLFVSRTPILNSSDGA